MNYKTLIQVFVFGIFLISNNLNAQHSVARQWNEANLEAIRNDFARPTIHARNLHHVGIAMYDAWAAYDSIAQPYLLGNTIGNFSCSFTNLPQVSNLDSAQNEAVSYAAYRVLSHRYNGTPGNAQGATQAMFDALMSDLGYDINITSVDYETGTPADLGNYIAQEIIAFGLQDGANEDNNYNNQMYSPVNEDLFMAYPGNENLEDPNRWQPLSVTLFIDQAGNPFPYTPPFLSPEWGQVQPFSLLNCDAHEYTRDSIDYYKIYHDPGNPPYIDTLVADTMNSNYKWGFTLVSMWSSHLDPADSVMIDISPASIGNIPLDSLPIDFDDYDTFYDLTFGGDASTGRSLNPSTGMSYVSQIVPRGDYARILAEFWADGPDSETPPGHWFDILNYVSDHDSLEKKWNGTGSVLSDLEWDVKTYFTLGGAMHDAAISAWSIKGWHDYIRPVSAIRWMAEKGQSSDTTLSNFHPAGIPLVEGFVEVVDSTDALVGIDYEHLGKIKLYAWKGPDYIDNEDTDVAGVDWILAENWWPYQRPSFVTPPFAGYISGHSTFSRAAAEVMTLMTGDEYFPGGMGEFYCPENEFLVFEDGPSQDVTLQWATYRDASDQCSLSRIWGGIHPPADDIPGRLIGYEVGQEAFELAEYYMKIDSLSFPLIECACNGDTIDSDLDGVLDCFDECPTDPNKIEEGICGCGVDDYNSNGVPGCPAAEIACETSNFLEAPTGVNSTINSNNVSLNWDTYIGATACQIKGNKTSLTNDVGLTVGNINNAVSPNQRTVWMGGLEPGETYRWKVRCGCSVSPIVASPFSEYAFFNVPFPGQMELNNPAESFNHFDKVLLEDELSIYPNPTNGLVYLSSYFDDFQVNIFDVNGKKVHGLNIFSAGENQIDLKHLGVGVYTIQFLKEEIVQTKKLVIQD